MIEDGRAMVDLAPEIVMTGEEMYPISGKMLTEWGLAQIYKECKGLQLYGDCLAKNLKAFEFLHDNFGVAPVLCMGALEIGYRETEYGFLYNPPHEFHAFLCFPKDYGAIVDVALPGAILRGQRMRDERGYFLCGPYPMVLAGDAEMFQGRLKYTVHEVYTYGNAKKLLTEGYYG